MANGKARPRREMVYQYLKDQMNARRITPGSFLDLALIGKELGISRSPLRDALFQLEAEGFLTIYPRHGVMVNQLDLKTIKNIYEIIGSLESTALANTAVKFTESDIDEMDRLNNLMQTNLDKEDYQVYYDNNVKFHDVFLSLSDNDDLLHTVKILRERLYDFPRAATLLKEWEQSNLNEHRGMIGLLRAGNFNGAAECLRDVHWSFAVQERFIKRYYFAPRSE